MPKKKLANKNELEIVLKELNDDSDTLIDYEDETKPFSFPCIMVYSYSDDVEIGSVYRILFVYPSDFN